MKKTRWAVIALVLVVALALAVAAAGCGTSGGGSTSATGSAGTPKQGGTLTVGNQGEPTGLDPAIAYENDSWDLENMLYNTFLKYAGAPGEAGSKLVPDLAEAMPTISADGKTYTFKLRQGVKFAPPVNREVTADDFKWSFERMMKLPKAPATFFYEGIVGAKDYENGKAADVSGFKVVDKYTVQIDLVKPDPRFLNIVSMPFMYVVPKEWVTKWGAHFNRHPLGSGQYVMESWTAGQKMLLNKNPNYFDPSKVYADQWAFDFTPTPARQLLLLQRGQIDIMGNDVAPADLVRVSNDPKWKNNVASGPEIAFSYTFFNVKYKPFDNQTVRQAICYAINREKLVKLQSGAAAVLNQIYPAGMPGHEANATYYPYDPDKAKQLLAQAGYPNGFKTTYYCLNTDPWPKIAQSIINDLQAIGIKAGLKLMDEATYWTATSAPATGISIGFSDWYMDFPDPSDWIDPLFSKASTVTGGMNAGNWWDPQVEALSKQASTMPPSQARIDLYTKIQQIIMEKAAVDPMTQMVGNHVFGPNVGGYYLHPVWINNYIDYWKK